MRNPATTISKIDKENKTVTLNTTFENDTPDSTGEDTFALVAKQLGLRVGATWTLNKEKLVWECTKE